MKTLCVFLTILMVGCANVATTPAKNQGEANGPDLSPRLVIPATGGPPILCTPLGGGVYQPVTGGTPIPGTPVNQ